MVEKKKTLLKDLIINRIDLVPEGDNPEARIVLFKNKEGGDHTEDISKAQWWMDVQTYFNLKGEDIMSLKEILEKLSEGEQQFLTKTIADKDKVAKDAMEAKDKEAKKVLEAKDVELKKAQDALAKAKVKEPGAAEPEDIWKNANPKIKEAYDKLTEKQEKDSKEVKKLSTQIMEADFVEKAKTFKGLSIKPEDFGKTLMKVSNADPKAFEEINKVLHAADKAIVESKLFEEQGRAGKAESGAYAKIKEMAKKVVDKSEGKVTQEAAEQQVVEANPELYKQYQEEREV